jgi:cytochrome c oxidase cbb3-type subunit 4
MDDGYEMFRSVMTVLELVAFLGIVWWAWGSARRTKFDEAAQLPFSEDQSLTAQGASAPSTIRGRK